MWGFSWKEVFTSAMVLFAVIDIIGSIPIVIELRRKTGEIHAGKATIVAMVIMITFLFVGERILEIINIDIGSFAIAGSFILFLMALEMIMGIK
ncbi:MAG: MarC family protein, partial [Flavobacteriales bacterium]